MKFVYRKVNAREFLNIKDQICLIARYHFLEVYSVETEKCKNSPFKMYHKHYFNLIGQKKIKFGYVIIEHGKDTKFFLLRSIKQQRIN